MIEPFTVEDVELVACALLEQGCPRPATDEARAILDALAAAGRLVPPGSETQEEWGARLTWVDGHIEDQGATDRAHAEHWVAFHGEHIGNDWRVRQADLINRKVITTPWSPSVPDTKEGGDA